MGRDSSATDLSDAEWDLLQPLIPPPRPGGRRRDVNCREILNAVFYLRSRGSSWRQLPLDLPPWQTVYGYLRDWRQDGTWTRMQNALCNAAARGAIREATLRAALDEPPAARQQWATDQVMFVTDLDGQPAAIPQAA